MVDIVLLLPVVAIVTGQVRHDISWFDLDSSAVGILTTRLESEASAVRKSLKHPSIPDIIGTC